ncbi:MAG: hypothetical protein L6Q83_01200 [Gammaproteobacteria bacterium]|nr:hypothetical protein [Gammaproteobacteria bacterium]
MSWNWACTSIERRLAAGLLLLCACSGPTIASDATALRQQYETIKPELTNTSFSQPLHLTSAQTANALSGHVHAVVGHPFATIRLTLRTAAQWCDVLILHLNAKRCVALPGKPSRQIVLSVGRKHEQALENTREIRFSFDADAQATDYLALRMHADSGPFGTNDYELSLEVTPLDATQSYLHLSYAYTYGVAARLAASTYLGTVGRNRIGFSTVGQTGDGRPIHVGGLRGAIERNVMRYFLAIDAYLETTSLPSEVREERRLRAWFAATERYPLQLKELTKSQYLDMKRKELARQRDDSSG